MLLSVEQYYPLKLPQGHIASKVTSPFVKCYFVLSKTIAPDSSPFSCISCLNLVITFTSFRPSLSFSSKMIAPPHPLSVIMFYTLAYHPLTPNQYDLIHVRPLIPLFQLSDALFSTKNKDTLLFFLESAWKGGSYLKALWRNHLTSVRGPLS